MTNQNNIKSINTELEDLVFLATQFIGASEQSQRQENDRLAVGRQLIEVSERIGSYESATFSQEILASAFRTAVSEALNNVPEKSDKTRQREEIIEKLTSGCIQNKSPSS